jgi:acyl-CoA synthetase (AMP-forming)/AMP-acid ligase II
MTVDARPGAGFSFLECSSFECAAAEAIARNLEEAGIRSTDLVALAIPDAESLLRGFLGVSRVAAAAPVDCKLAEQELQSRLRLLNPRALMTAVDPDPKLLRAAEGAGVPTFRWNFPTLPALKRGARSVGADVSAVLQTSATTGEPKLAPLTEGNLAAMIANVQRAFDLRADDRLLCFMPPHHLGGLLACLAQLFAGGTVVCSSAPGEFFDLLETHRPTWYLAGPTVHRAILRAAQERPDGLRQNSLRFIRSGSAAITPDLIQALEAAFDAPVIHGYGMTEAGVVTSTGSTEKGCVGKSIGVEIGIMNHEGLIQPPATEGEIVLRGDAVIQGYLDDRDANRAAFTKGWFRTGDLGWLNPNGELFITGRLREMINRGGEKILPDEIDCVLVEHPSVQAAAAFAVAHPTLGEDVAAAVVLRAGVTTDEFELTTHMASRVGPGRLPSLIFFVDEIPVGETGKPRRHQLAKSLAGAADRHAAMVTEDLVERRIAEVWAQVLGRSILPGKNENFFAIGGDSLAWTRMTAILESEMGFDVRHLVSPHLSASPTVAVLKDLIGQGRASRQSPRVDAVVLEEGGGPPFFCFPGAALDAAYLRPLARFVGQPFVVLRDTGWDPMAGVKAFEELINRFVVYIRETQPQPPGGDGRPLLWRNTGI